MFIWFTASRIDIYVSFVHISLHTVHFILQTLDFQEKNYFLINWIDVGIKLGPSFSAAGHTITNQIHSKSKWVYCVLRMSSSLYIQLLQPLIDNSVFVVVVSSPIEGKLFPSYLFSAITSQHSSRCVSRDNCYLLVCLFETCFRYEYR
jgi:hypothetical protein